MTLDFVGNIRQHKTSPQG